MKKSQISVYAIIGIILVSLTALFIYISYHDKIGKSTENSHINVKKENLQNYIGLCLEDATRNLIFDEIAASGGYSNKTLGSGEIDVYTIHGKRIAYWNDGIREISPSIEDIKNDAQDNILNLSFMCFSNAAEILPGISADAGSYTNKDNVMFEINEDNIDTVFESGIIFNFLGEKAHLDKLHSRLDYNLKKDLELSKKILKEAIMAQPGYYDITLNCMNYSTNGKTNIFSIDAPNSEGGFVTIISVIDYEPLYRDLNRPLRINFALKNIKVMGFCSS